MKYAMSVSGASKLGRDMAAIGWTVAQIESWLAERGYSKNGVTKARMMRAYNRQLARG